MGPAQYSMALLPFLLDLCTGERTVSIQKGRLYRAKGYHVTIWCNVSGYQGSPEQDFQWSIYLPSAPQRELQIISTNDISFPYTLYSQRVRSGEIYIERIKGDSVLLHLAHLKEQDAGEYECYTPNTDDVYLGSYSARTNLSVISDTLFAMMDPEVLIKDQGESVELTCEASTSTDQHTHLSVTWFLFQNGGRQLQEIISLSRDFVLLPGSSYNQRFSSGDIRLDKVGGKQYKLSIVNVQPSDQGELYCEAVEWIQDPDETWKDIARKQSSRTSLTIRSLDKRIYINISVAERSLLEGETLQINCYVQAQNSQHRQFQMVWHHQNLTMASIDPYGTLSFQNDNEKRHSMGRLIVKKHSNDNYILKINHVQVDDRGTYSCEVSEMEITPTGSLTIIQQQSSLDANINVRLKESSLQLFMWSNKEQITEGEALILHCNASVAENLLSVNWWHIKKDGNLSETVATMDQDGRLNIGPSYFERSACGDLRLEKMDLSSFTLTIYNTSATYDTGHYRCEVTEWSKYRNWKHTQEVSVKIKPLGLDLKAGLSTRTPNVKLHKDFELFCKVSPDDITNKALLSITWQFKHSSDLHDYQKVVKITARGTVEWGTAHLHFQKKTKITKLSTLSQLLVHTATRQDAGMYKCEIEVWRPQWRAGDLPAGAATVVSSNPLQINVIKPESKLSVNMDTKFLEVSGNEDIKMDCKIMSLTDENFQLGVAWYFLPVSSMDGTPQLIIKTNYSNIWEYGEAFTSSHQKSKFYGEKISSRLYQLHIFSVNSDVLGEYYCEVDEWTWSVDSEWLKLGRMKSGKTKLNFRFSEKKLHIEKTNHTITVAENEDVILKCVVQKPVQPTSRFSITWFKESENSSVEALVKIKENGIIEYSKARMARRLRPYCLSFGEFCLTLMNVEKDDAGLFYCQVEEFQEVSCRAADIRYALDQSGKRRVVVLPSASANPTQFCSSPSLYYFLIFYPPVLFLVIMAVSLIKRFRAQYAHKAKLDMKKNKAPDEELDPVAPTCIKTSDRGSSSKAEEETTCLDGEEVD